MLRGDRFDGRLIVLAYTAGGFVPAIIEPRPLQDVSAIKFLGTALVDRYPELKTWQVPPPSTVNYESQVIRSGPYRPLEHAGLDNAYPILQGYKNSVGLGYHANFGDPLGFFNLGVTAAYTPTGGLPGNERAHLNVDGHYLFWRGSLAWNRSDFTTSSDPRK